MIKKIIITLISLILISSVFAVEKEFPTKFPKSCMKKKVFQGVYCSKSAVKNKRVKFYKKNGKLVEKLSLVVNVKIFLKAGKDDYDLEDIVGRFFDFDSWDEYAEGHEEVVRYTKSLDIGDETIQDPNGDYVVKRHYVNYKMMGPTGWNNVRTVGYYRVLDTPIKNSLFSATFENQTKGLFQVTGEDDLIGGEGFRYTVGEFHIKDNGDHFMVYFTTDIKPSVRGGELLAGESIERGILALLKGMFEVE